MLKRLGLALMAASAISAGSAWAEPQHFVVMANGEKVGQLDAEVGQRTVASDYAVSNNGRGPKAKETIVLDSQGRPIHWAIDGSSLFGSPVSEQFDFANGEASWVSQADKGSVKAATAPLYAANDASPWINGLYVKALLSAPNHTLPVLPSGQMHLETVKTLTVGDGAKAVNLTIYEITGVDLEPRYVLMDEHGALFGLLGGGLIRAGYESELPKLTAVGQEIALQRAHEATKALAHRFAGPVRIAHVHIFDPKTLSFGPLSTVGIYGERITTVEPDADAVVSPGETLIDGQGGYLMAGLHDMHNHTSLQSNLLNLAAGVTDTRDMGNKNETLLAWLKEMKAGQMMGPRIVANGFLEGRSPYSAREGFVVDNLQDALKAVHWYADHGYWQIKIYNSFNPDWVKPTADEAHKLGMGVTGHVPAFSNPDRVLKEGYRTIAHINQLMLGWLLTPSEDTRTPLRLTGMIRAKDLDLNSPKVQTTVALMKEKNASLDTTDVIVEHLMLSRSGEVAEGDAYWLAHMPIGFQRYEKRSFVTLDKPGMDQDYRTAFKTVLKTTKLLYDNGVQLLPGTDLATGFPLHRELELYVKAGIPAPRVLKMATFDCETYFGKEADYGSIERGKVADLILVPNDPTKDINNVREVRMSMVGGVAYYPAEIYKWVGIKPFASPPSVSAPPPAKPRPAAAVGGGALFGWPLLDDNDD